MQKPKGNIEENPIKHGWGGFYRKIGTTHSVAKQPKTYKKPTVEIDVKAVAILSQFSEPSHSYNV